MKLFNTNRNGSRYKLNREYFFQGLRNKLTTSRVQYDIPKNLRNCRSTCGYGTVPEVFLRLPVT
jgi:hypothetical protein